MAISVVVSGLAEAGNVGGSSGKAELSLGVFLQRAKLGLGVPRWGGWSDDLMSMCEGERPVDCEG